MAKSNRRMFLKNSLVAGSIIGAAVLSGTRNPLLDTTTKPSVRSRPKQHKAGNEVAHATFLWPGALRNHIAV